MRLHLIFLLVSCGCYLVSCAQTIPNRDAQIGAAVLAAPEDMREGATVLGFDSEGKIVTIREGTNNFYCIADNPNQKGFNVACYHKNLEPFMARGRALKAEGKKGGEIFEIREAEAKSGKLQMPEAPSTLYVYSGKDGQYNEETGEVTGASLRYVVYIPFATAESTGLPTKEVTPGGPWIMDPGTHRAHIMITPPRE